MYLRTASEKASYSVQYHAKHGAPQRQPTGIFKRTAAFLPGDALVKHPDSPGPFWCTSGRPKEKGGEEEDRWIRFSVANVDNEKVKQVCRRLVECDKLFGSGTLNV